jgi:peptidyl-prolyl cis-trans isomerase A (cyclophilin A)
MRRKSFERLLFLIFLTMILFACGNKNPKIIIKTEFGDIIIELYQKQAPHTVVNFLKYIKENRFEEATFYRVVRLDNQSDNENKIEVIQGGLFEDDHPKALPPIIHESTLQTGILHKNGVISMARYEPGTATSEFFICIGDQPGLDFKGERNTDRQGFAAFGKVIKGMDVVREIQKQNAIGQYLDPRIKIIEIVILWE